MYVHIQGIYIYIQQINFQIITFNRNLFSSKSGQQIYTMELGLPLIYFFNLISLHLVSLEQ